MGVDFRASAAAMTSRSRSRSLRRHASTEIDPATEDESIPISVARHTPPSGAGEATADRLLRPQVAAFALPEHYAHDDLDLDASGVIYRAEIRRCSIRSWWKIRYRLRSSGGVSTNGLKAWGSAGWPGCVVLNSGVAWEVATAEHDVIIDEPAERMLWSTWGEALWVLLLRAERDSLLSLGLSATLDRVHLLSDASLGIPPSPFGIMPRSI